MHHIPNDAGYLNLVFQGGGVRGIAYAGVLASLPESCQIYSVGGTSAGAIVAGLLAIGIKGVELKNILSDKRLFNLLDQIEVARMERLKAAWTAAEALWEGGPNSKIGLWEVGGFTWKHRKLLADFREIWQVRGFHSSDNLRNWLDSVLKGKLFKDIVVDDLRIVASDVSGRAFKTYDKTQNLNTPIAEAVQASASIPIFFSPFTVGKNYLVDGGILSNFPSFLFAQGKYPTVGFRLADMEIPGPVMSTLGYLKALVTTMAEAHDKHRGDPPNFKAYSIDTPAHIPSTKFALDNRDVDELYTIGLALGRTVDWYNYSSPSPVISFYEPRAQETLQFSLSQTRRVWDSYYNRQEFWVDSLNDDAEFTVRVEKDWTTKYERKSAISVGGEKPLVMTVFKAVGTPSGTSGVLSYMDIDHYCEELTDQGPKDLIRVPAYNDSKTKGFLVFFDPHISKDHKPRVIRTGFCIEREFAKTVALGVPDEVGFTATQIAIDHTLKLRVRIRVDFDLGPMLITPEFPATVGAGSTWVDESTGRSYRTYECQVAETKVVRNIDYAFEIAKKKT